MQIEKSDVARWDGKNLKVREGTPVAFREPVEPQREAVSKPVSNPRTERDAEADESVPAVSFVPQEGAGPQEGDVAGAARRM